jgi:hypothetical protein
LNENEVIKNIQIVGVEWKTTPTNDDTIFACANRYRGDVI